MDFLTSYTESISQLRKSIYGINDQTIQDFGLLGTYKVVSANLSSFLPHIGAEKHLELIKRIHFNRSQAIIDQKYPFLLNHLSVIDNSNCIKCCKKKGFIITTYHTGSYRLLISLLTSLNINFCLVTEKNFIDTQSEQVKSIFNELRKNLTSNKNNEDLEILNAEDPKLFLKLIRKLKEKKSIVFYLDGNTGTNEFSVSKEKLLKVKFLEKYIFARKGISFLSHVTKTPIITAVSKRISDTDNEIKFELIENNNFMDERNLYVQTITKKLYDYLSDFIRLNPDQWEGWFYLQKFAVRKESKISDSSLKNKEFVTESIFNKHVKFNSREFELINFDSKGYFLIDKQNYSVSKITPDLFKIIYYFSKPKKITGFKDFNIEGLILEDNAISELFLSNILCVDKVG